jgi:hypothetical protein
VELVHIPLPDELQNRIENACRTAAEEVTPPSL